MRMLLALLLLAVTAHTRPTNLYTYKDENGTVHAVDSPDDVPEKYRSQSKALTHDPNEHFVGDDPCEGKKLCATIYVAPWCADCQNQTQDIKRYLTQNNGTRPEGFRVIVGYAVSSESVDETVKSFGYGAVSDEFGHTFEKLGVKELPSFYVHDEKGALVKSGADAQRWISDNFNPKGWPPQKILYTGTCPPSKRPRPLPSLAAGGGGASLAGCGSKRYCATIYVSPWCPYCKARASEFQRYVNGRGGSERGVRVVVGAGRKPGDNNRTAASYGGSGVADNSGGIAQALGVYGYPSFFVQENGAVILQGGAAEGWIRNNF